MYGALDQDLLLQEIRDRKAGVSAHRGKATDGWPNRRWRRKGSR